MLKKILQVLGLLRKKIWRESKRMSIKNIIKLGIYALENVILKKRIENLEEQIKLQNLLIAKQNLRIYQLEEDKK